MSCRQCDKLPYHHLTAGLPAPAADLLLCLFSAAAAAVVICCTASRLQTRQQQLLACTQQCVLLSQHSSSIHCNTSETWESKLCRRYHWCHMLSTPMANVACFAVMLPAWLLCFATQVAKAESVLMVDAASSRALRLINVLNLYIVNDKGQVGPIVEAAADRPIMLQVDLAQYDFPRHQLHV